MTITDDLKTFANTYHKNTGGKYLPKLPNDIIMNILRHTKPAKVVHREKYTDVLKQLLKKVNPDYICARMGNMKEFWEWPHFHITPIYGYKNDKQMLTRSESKWYPEGKLYNITDGREHSSLITRWVSEKELELYLRMRGHMCYRSQCEWQEPNMYFIHTDFNWRLMANNCVSHLWNFVVAYRFSFTDMEKAEIFVERYHILRWEVANLEEFRHLKRVYDMGAIHWTQKWVDIEDVKENGRGGHNYYPDYKHRQELNGYELYVKKFSPILPTYKYTTSGGVAIFNL